MANLTGGREGPLRAECLAVMGVHSLHKQRSRTPQGRRALSTRHSVPPHSPRSSCKHSGNQNKGTQPRVPWTSVSTTVHTTGPARHSTHGPAMLPKDVYTAPTPMHRKRLGAPVQAQLPAELCREHTWWPECLDRSLLRVLHRLQTCLTRFEHIAPASASFARE
jgi:hypothetical protein